MVFFQRIQLYVVQKVLANKKPELYYLVDLNSDKVPGTFYLAQLHKTRPPKDSEFFEVESVLKTATKNGVKMNLVKYVGYPAKFNRWLPATNLK